MLQCSMWCGASLYLSVITLQVDPRTGSLVRNSNWIFRDGRTKSEVVMTKGPFRMMTSAHQLLECGPKNIIQTINEEPGVDVPEEGFNNFDIDRHQYSQYSSLQCFSPSLQPNQIFLIHNKPSTGITGFLTLPLLENLWRIVLRIFVKTKVGFVDVDKHLNF